MTVSTTSNRKTYTADGISATFAFPYKFIATSDINVYVNGVLQTSGYSVGTPTDSGANVMFSVAPVSGATIVILSDPSRTQSTSLPTTGPFPAKSVETMSDKLTLLVQRLYDLITRSVTLADGDASGASTTLPSPVANNLLAWDATATKLVDVPASSLATTIVANTWVTDKFSGTGAQTAFTLSAAPGNINAVFCSISGVHQTPGTDFTLVGNVLTFTSAPPVGTNNILVQYGQTVSTIGTADLTNTTGTLDASKIAGALNGITSVNSGPLYGNRVINGAMEIDQQNVGAFVTVTASQTFTMDTFVVSSSQSSKLQIQQAVTSGLAGFKNCFLATVNASYASLAADAFSFYTALEGQNIVDFQLGATGNTASFTVSFWVKVSVSGTYSFSVCNAAGNRSYVTTFSATTAWTQVKITIPSDTTGTWATDNTVGLYLRWDLGFGSNYTAPAVNAWQAGNYGKASGATSFVGLANNNTIQITGVDCRLGSVAPAYFERRANELILCQRYFEKSYAQPTSPGTVVSAGGGGVTIGGAVVDTSKGSTIGFKATKRTTSPTITIYDNAGTAGKISAFTGSWTNGQNMAVNQSNDSSLSVQANGVASCTGISYDWTASSRLT